MQEKNTFRKTYTEFLEAVLTFESSIDPKMAAEYKDPTAIEYQKVEKNSEENYIPGRVVRNASGNYLTETTSYKTYFHKIGVDHLYIPGSPSPEMFKKMQYAVINFLGFVGYRFSELDLQILGYYEHRNLLDIPVYYSDVDNSHWADGVRYYKAVRHNEISEEIINERVRRVIALKLEKLEKANHGVHFFHQKNVKISRIESRAEL